MKDRISEKPGIMHIDDDPNQLEIFRLFFDEKFEITSLERGEEVVSHLSVGRYDAVITDYEMPGMNGLEVLSEIIAIDPEIPVIFVTGQGNESVAREAFKMGAVDYFTKDFGGFAHREKLENSILKAIEQNRIHREKVRAENQIVHLNSVLKAIRNVNQMIVQEKDKSELLKKACDCLVETREYERAWIFLYDEESDYFRVWGSNLSEPVELTTHKYIDSENYLCIRKALDTSDVVRIEEGERCLDCPLVKERRGNNFFAIRLEYSGKNHGVLLIDCVNDISDNEEEKSLLMEVAGDISYALNNLSVENERNLIMIELEDSEESFREMFSAMDNCVAVYRTEDGGESFVIKDFNRSAEIAENISRENVIGREIRDVFPAVDVFGFFEVLQRVWRTDVPENFPVKFYNDRRITGWRENYVYKLSNGDVVAIYKDVTEQKLAEQNIRHLNSVLRAIRNVNQLVVMEHDREVLNRNVCRVIVESREYERAWFLITDEEGNLQKSYDSDSESIDAQSQPVLFSTLDGFIRELQRRFRCDEEYRDVSDFFPLKSDSLSSFYIALCLHYSGMRFGCLIIESRSEIASDSEEFELIKEMGYDIAYALYNYETEKLKDQAESEILKLQSLLMTAMQQNIAGVIMAEKKTGNVIFSNSIAGKILEIEPLDNFLMQEDGRGYHYPLEGLKYYNSDGIPLSVDEYPLRRGLNGETVNNLNLVIEYPGGRKKHLLVNTSPVYSADGEITAAVSIFLDVTASGVMEPGNAGSPEERMAVFERIDSAVAFYEMVYNENDEPVDYLVTAVNPAFLSAVGRSRDETVGRHLSEVLGLQQYSHLEELDRVAREQIPTRFEIYIPILSKYVLVSAFSYKKGELITMFMDVTNHKELEKKLLSINNELMDFASTVSHDLKNSCNLIRAYLQVIRDNREKFDRYYDKVIEQADWMVEFVENLLNLSRAGKIISDKYPIRLEGTISRIIKMYESREQEIKTAFHLDEGVVYGDPTRLEQIFSNIIQNAVKHSGNMQNPLELTVKSYSEEDFTIVSISDNGSGIEEKIMGKIFKSGYSTNKQIGTGFGLAISKKLVEAHGGAIWCESAGRNRGSTFFIKLPSAGSDDKTLGMKREVVTI